MPSQSRIKRGQPRYPIAPEHAGPRVRNISPSVVDTCEIDAPYESPRALLRIIYCSRTEGRRMNQSCWSAQPQGNSAQTAFRRAIFCAMNSSSRLLAPSVRPKSLRNFDSIRASFPELPHPTSPTDLRFGRFGSLGGSSPS